MEDITLCRGGSCPMKKNCHRYRKKIPEGELYFPLPPEIAGCCDKYMEIIPHGEYFSKNFVGWIK